MVDVEFQSNLANGQTVFVMAQVGQSVEILHVMTSPDCDGVDIPLPSLSHADILNLEYDASQEAYERSTDVEIMDFERKFA